MRLLAWLLPLLALLALAQDVATQEKRVKDLEAEAARAKALEQETQARIQKLNQALARLSKRVADLLQEKARLEKEIARLEAERAALRQEIARLEEAVRETEARIAKLEKDLAALKERLRALMQSLHRERAGRYLPLLRAQSFTDLAVRARWVGYISKQDADLVRQLQATLKALGEERERLKLLLQSLSEKERALAETQRKLEAERQNLLTTLASLRKEEEGKKALLRDALTDRQRLQSALAQLQARVLAERQRLLLLKRQEEERRRQEEERRRQEEARRKQATLKPSPSPGAGWWCPTARKAPSRSSPDPSREARSRPPRMGTWPGSSTCPTWATP